MNDISPKIQPYRSHPQATIISCYFNPQNYQSRARNFEIFYEHLKRSNVNYLIGECAFGVDDFELPADNRIIGFRSKHPLWQKEILLNLLVKQLPESCGYIFWLDADVLFTNPNWLVEAVENLQTNKICQPFSVAVRLEKDEIEPSFDVKTESRKLDYPAERLTERRLWRSFTYNYSENPLLANSPMFDVHGHTGFAWGARREVLETCPLFDKAVAGTADHIIAHAAAAQIPNQCVEKAFKTYKTRERIYEWSHRFSGATQNKLSYVPGELWHLWHGDLENRQYLSRTQELDEMEFDFDDLETNDDGLYEIAEHKRGIIDWIKDYFVSRDEDDNRVADPPPIAPPDSYIVPEASNYAASETISDYSETADTSGEVFGGNADFGGAGAGGSWENYS